MKDTTQGRQPGKKKIDPDHPVLGRFLGWLKALEDHASTQVDTADQEVAQS